MSLLQMALFHPDPDRNQELMRWTAAAMKKMDIRITGRSHTLPQTFIRDVVQSNDPPNIIAIYGSCEGFTYGKQIRARFRDTVIIFVDCEMNDVLEAFTYLPIAYVLRESSMSVYLCALKHAVQWLRINTCFTHRGKTETFKVPFEHIDYFESDYRNVLIHMDNNTTLHFFGRLDLVSQEVDQSAFFRCHQSYLINLSHVATYERTERRIVFQSGQAAYVSKAQHSAMLEVLEGEVR